MRLKYKNDHCRVYVSVSLSKDIILLVAARLLRSIKKNCLTQSPIKMLQVSLQ